MKKLISKLAALLLCSQFAVTASATTTTVNYDSTQDASAQQNVDVSVDCEIAEIYSVTLPKMIQLDGSLEVPEYEYTLKVTGDFSPSKCVRVIPLDGAVLEDGGIETPLTVSQEKRRWTMAEIEAAADNTAEYTAKMLAEDLEPGTWTGTVEFLVSLDEGGKLWRPASCESPAQLLGTDANDNGVLDTGEEATTTETKGVPLGHKFAEDEVAFPAVCQRCSSPCYTISNATQLTAFRDSVNINGKSYTGSTITLNNDIDMTGTVWNTGIGTDTSAFKGIFDGNNYSISNFNLLYDDSGNTSHYRGFFNYVGEDGVIKNFKLLNPIIDCGAGTEFGIVIGSLAGARMTNVHVNGGNISGNAKIGYNIGGLVNNLNFSSVLDNCSIINTTLYTDLGNNSSCGIGTLVRLSYGKVSNCLVSVYASLEDKRCNSLGVVARGASCVTSNTVVDTERTTYRSLMAEKVINISTTTTTGCKSDEALSVLNMNNTEYTWKLDLESINGGFPYPVKTSNA